MSQSTSSDFDLSVDDLDEDEFATPLSQNCACGGNSGGGNCTSCKKSQGYSV